MGPEAALALAGDVARARSLSADLDRRFGQDTLVQFNFLPAVRALIDLQRGDAVSALEELRSAEPYELSPPQELNGALYPVYVRGLALRAAHREQDAAREFQKILDRRGIYAADPVPGVMARLQHARGLALAGDRKGAAAEYGGLLHLWRDADASLGVVVSARREAQALEQGGGLPR